MPDYEKRRRDFLRTVDVRRRAMQSLTCVIQNYAERRGPENGVLQLLENR